MTRLDIGKMNKDYVDPDQMENSLERLIGAPITIKTRSSNVTLTAIQDVILTHDVAKVKSLLRNNQLPVDHESRTRLWALLCCGTTDDITDETFQAYASKFAHVAPEKMLPIEDMTEEMRVHHMLSTEGVKACHRVLYVISETHPQIQQFSPLLYAFTSVMLHYSGEQATFRCICELLKKKDINYFLAPTELNLVAACFVLRDLANRYAKPAASYIEKHCPDEDFIEFLNDWVLWIFKHLPFHYLVRIVDCYLVEGYKVLFRVALILIKHFHKLSVENTDYLDSGKPDAGMKKMCSEIHQHMSCDRLLKEAFGIRGISKKEINAFFKKTELTLRAGGRAISAPRPKRQISQHSEYGLPRPSSRSSKLGSAHANERTKRLLAMKTKKSFKLDKDIHTQLVIDDIDSDILNKLQQLKVWSWLPPAEAVKEPELAFTTNEDGYSLKTLYDKVENCGPTLLVIRTIGNDVFGAYCATDWVERHKQVDAGAQICFFGCGLSFVFKIHPEMVYYWVGKEVPVTLPGASMFQAGDKNILMVGGGGGCALQFDKDLDHGRTENCETFENMPLCDDIEFRIQCLEAFVFRS
ncbi:GTPase-activating protein skywalker-like isoform X2 [Watersipora subatra]|uniref:GTPase-activating protein skywalker-like isoform X2 n=1 Tax=Watersipora subatra TaxID=2589382 RepID=UPI00355AE217